MGKSRVAPATAIAIVGIVAVSVTGAFAAGSGFEAKNGKYRGAVGGNSGDIVRFTVARHRVVKHVAFDLITGSDSSCLIRFHLTRRGEINHDGEFQIVGGRAGTDRADAKKWIKGRFVTKKKVRGHVHAHVRGCGSAIAPFKAHLAHSR